MKMLPLIVAFIMLGPVAAQERELLRIHRSMIGFESKAPLETIAATNTKATGILDRNARTFAVQIPMDEFNGFNSPLQREHFNENYMLSRKWPNATFKGRMIEEVDLHAPGEYAVRAKGELTVRGITRERIIPCKVIVTAEGIRVDSAFDVLLDEHEIRVPRVVQQKIASVVQVEFNALFKAGSDPQ